MSTTINSGEIGMRLLSDRMEIEFEAEYDGNKIFNVRRIGEKKLFTGTLEQCRRFIDVYREKVLKHTA